MPAISATVWQELVAEFNAGKTKENLYSRLDEIHDIEHEGDKVHDEIIYELNRAFITPIEREDILAVAHDIDRITDHIENVAFRLWMFNIEALASGNAGICNADPELLRKGRRGPRRIRAF